MKDERRPLEAGLQEQASNHPKLLLAEKRRVASVWGKGGTKDSIR